MSKGVKKIAPKGALNFHSYAADNGGCGYIRLILPSILLSQWRYKGMSFVNTYGYRFIRDPEFYSDLAFVKFQRPAEPGHLQMIRHYLSSIRDKQKTPLFIELDDLLTGIPSTNFAHQYYESRKEYIYEMLRIVDGITVSTEKLKREMEKYNKNISVVQNYLYRFMWKDPEFRSEEYKKPRILYPGSFNHFNQTGKGGDFSKELISFIDKTREEYDWYFVGGYPKELEGKEGIYFYPWQSYLEYPRTLYSIRPTIAIAPLEDNLFNQCKSRIKHLEYSALGVPGIYQDIEPYKGTSQRASTSEEMIEKIKGLVQDPDLRKETWEKDLQNIGDRLFFEDNQKDWIDQHLRLVGKKLG